MLGPLLQENKVKAFRLPFVIPPKKHVLILHFWCEVYWFLIVLTRILIGHHHIRFSWLFLFWTLQCKEERKWEGREREERGGGGVGIDEFFFWGTEFMVVKTYIELSIYIYYSAARWVHLEKWHHLYLTLKFSNDFSTLYITTHNFCFFE